jgi:hypothetical protein
MPQVPFPTVRPGFLVLNRTRQGWFSRQPPWMPTALRACRTSHGLDVPHCPTICMLGSWSVVWWCGKLVGSLKRQDIIVFGSVWGCALRRDRRTPSDFLFCNVISPSLMHSCYDTIHHQALTRGQLYGPTWSLSLSLQTYELNKPLHFKSCLALGILL